MRCKNFRRKKSICIFCSKLNRSWIPACKDRSRTEVTESRIRRLIDACTPSRLLSIGRYIFIIISFDYAIRLHGFNTEPCLSMWMLVGNWSDLTNSKCLHIMIHLWRLGWHSCFCTFISKYICPSLHSNIIRTVESKANRILLWIGLTGKFRDIVGWLLRVYNVLLYIVDLQRISIVD